MSIHHARARSFRVVNQPGMSLLGYFSANRPKRHPFFTKLSAIFTPKLFALPYNVLQVYSGLVAVSRTPGGACPALDAGEKTTLKEDTTTMFDIREKMTRLSPRRLLRAAIPLPPPPPPECQF